MYAVAAEDVGATLMTACVSWALMMIIGRDEPVICRALLRYVGDDWVRVDEGVLAVTPAAATAVLIDLGFKVFRYTGPTATVGEWAGRSEGRRPPVMLFIEKHALVVRGGLIYDNHVPEGVPESEYPLRGEPVESALRVRASPV